MLKARNELRKRTEFFPSISNLFLFIEPYVLINFDCQPEIA